MMLGREARLPEDLIYGLPVGGAPVPQGGREYVEHLKKAMQNAYKSIRDEVWKEMQHQKNVYDERQNERQCYQKGDFVWLHCPAVPRGHSPKFHRPWQGPYEVEEKLGDVVYRIRKNRQAKQLTVHFNRLKPYTQPVMGHPTGETIEEQRKPEGRRGEPVNREDYLDEEMFIVTSEPARPVVTSERMPEANTETPTPQEPQCNVPIPTDHQPDVPQLRRSTRLGLRCWSVLRYIRNGFKHVRSAPYHPATNGLAERAVQTVKDALKKTSDVADNVKQNQQRQKQNHDQRATERFFGVGDKVSVINASPDTMQITLGLVNKMGEEAKKMKTKMIPHQLSVFKTKKRKPCWLHIRIRPHLQTLTGRILHQPQHLHPRKYMFTHSLLQLR
eukprot:Em0010g244a